MTCWWQRNTQNQEEQHGFESSINVKYRIRLTWFPLVAALPFEPQLNCSLCLFQVHNTNIQLFISPLEAQSPECRGFFFVLSEANKKHFVNLAEEKKQFWENLWSSLTQLYVLHRFCVSLPALIIFCLSMAFCFQRCLTLTAVWKHLFSTPEKGFLKRTLTLIQYKWCVRMPQQGFLCYCSIYILYKTVKVSFTTGIPVVNPLLFII